MSGDPPRARRVRCPGCGRDSEFAPTNPYRPFCSERCKSGDFGAWASERYRVEAPASSAPAPDDTPPPDAH
jgi:endogenous inhibitor of DNA gyrase (YacG/DUF329 family)